MAKSVVPSSYRNGFKQPGTGSPWQTKDRALEDPLGYVTPPSSETLTSSIHNDLGINVLRTWPTMYDGTNAPAESIPKGWKPQEKVDCLICGAGPSGLQVGISLLRQGLTFRIVDSSETPLIAGRADGVQPRFLETLNCWGLADEVAEEGPLIERTAVYKDGKKLLYGRSHQSDSRYRGLHIVTQGQLERIYIRDFLRHNVLVERNTTVVDYQITKDPVYPVSARIQNEKTGETSEVQAKYLVGSDGASSKIRKSLDIPFDGVSTGIYWGIMDCIFESDYPHAWTFGSVVSSKHGGCVIIPREDGYIRLYTQLDVSMTGPLAHSRSERNASLQESGGAIDTKSITPDEVLMQANRIFAPYKLRFAAPLSWFAIWKISERVARSFSSPDQRVHLVGDAAHVHSVMGAFGLNASIMDAANLSWKLGLCAQHLADPLTLLPTYSAERRLQAQRIIRTSGSYLRFVCNSEVPLAAFDNLDGAAAGEMNGKPVSANGTATPSEKTNGVKAQVNGAVKESSDPAEDLAFLGAFFKDNGPFLLGVDAPFNASILNTHTEARPHADPISTRNGVRCPNPRVCLSSSSTGYLYDTMLGASHFHILLFTSAIMGHIKDAFSSALSILSDTKSWYSRLGGKTRFNVVVVAKMLPFELAERVSAAEMLTLQRECTVVFDDRAPDEDAHTTFEVDHGVGAGVVVRPDLWVGEAVGLEEVERLGEYFGGFLKEGRGR